MNRQRNWGWLTGIRMSYAKKPRPRDFSMRRNPVHWIIATAVLLISMIVLGTAMLSYAFRDRALTSATREIENTASLLTRHFDTQFDELQRIRKSVGASLSNNGIVSARSFSQQISGHDTHLMLKAQRGDAGSGIISLIDTDGRLINWSQSWPLPDIEVSQTEWFNRLKASTEPELEIVQAVHGRADGRWTTMFARRLVNPQGIFLGVITRYIEPVEIERFFTSVLMGRKFSVTMVLMDGSVLAKYPLANARPGERAASSPVHTHLQQNATSPISGVGDGSNRLAAIRTLHNTQIAIAVTQKSDDVLADWYEQTRSLVTLGLLSALIIAALLYLIMREVAEQHRASQFELVREKERLNTAINNMSQGLLLFDGDARMVVCNQRYIDMYGLSKEIIKPGCHFRDIIAHRKASGSFLGDVDTYCDAILEKNRRHTLGQPVGTIIETADGRSVHVLDGRLPDGGWVATHEDITERRHAEQRIAHLAQYDALTDLPNRSLFHDRLEQELALLSHGQQCAIIYIDIDQFKSINDSLGHTVGDDLLKTVATRLRACVRDRDVVARLGGDEFAVVLTDIKRRSDVTDLITRIHAAIREPSECQGHRLLTDASIGIALAPQDGCSREHLLKNADLAMYSAKADGRHTFRFFEPEMDARVTARRALELDLRDTVEHGDFARAGFEVYYQPLVSLETNEITGCEALLRWRHPVRGMVSPAEFIPVAEEIGVISKFGDWVLTTACTEAATWPGALKIAVNVSPVQFRNQSLALNVIQALSASGLPADRLELEITEAVLIRDDEVALTILHRLRDIGVRIALDDFGTGYSSLSYLQRFPFDKIKIDRCFVGDINDARGSRSIVQAVVTIATARNMTTTAEGVESPEQRELLRVLGCTEMQGYLFSPARPAGEVYALIAHHAGLAPSPIALPSPLPKGEVKEEGSDITNCSITHFTSVNCISSVRCSIEKLSSEISVSTISPSTVTCTSRPSKLSISKLISASIRSGPSSTAPGKIDAAAIRRIRTPPPLTHENLRSSSSRSPSGRNAASLMS